MLDKKGNQRSLRYRNERARIGEDATAEHRKARQRSHVSTMIMPAAKARMNAPWNDASSWSMTAN
jgi:hypothetical protein